MPRPALCRRVASAPVASVFKPAGIPTRALEAVTLALDEYEALRLADHEGLDQAAAAPLLGVSRPTFGRILAAARRKVASVLVGGRALFIQGGPVHVGPPFAPPHVCHRPPGCRRLGRRGKAKEPQP